MGLYAEKSAVLWTERVTLESKLKMHISQGSLKKQNQKGGWLDEVDMILNILVYCMEK